MFLPVGTGAFVARDLRRPGLLRGQLKHWGVPVAPKRSTLAYANEHRRWQRYQTVFEQTLYKCQELVQSLWRAEKVPLQKQADEPRRRLPDRR